MIFLLVSAPSCRRRELGAGAPLRISVTEQLSPGRSRKSPLSSRRAACLPAGPFAADTGRAHRRQTLEPPFLEERCARHLARLRTAAPPGEVAAILSLTGPALTAEEVDSAMAAHPAFMPAAKTGTFLAGQPRSPRSPAGSTRPTWSPALLPAWRNLPTPATSQRPRHRMRLRQSAPHDLRGMELAPGFE
jgi:hypothetical protein